MKVSLNKTIETVYGDTYKTIRPGKGDKPAEIDLTIRIALLEALNIPKVNAAGNGVDHVESYKRGQLMARIVAAGADIELDDQDASVIRESLPAKWDNWISTSVINHVNQKQTAKAK